MSLKIVLGAVFISLFGSVILSQAVFAQEDGGGVLGIFDLVKNLITGGKDLPTFYEENAGWVDFIIYAVFFVCIANFGLQKMTGQGMSKALPTVMGIALAIGVAVLLPEFSLIRSSAFLGIILLFGSLFYILYSIISHMVGGYKRFSLALSYFIVGIPGIPLLSNASDYGYPKGGLEGGGLGLESLAAILGLFWLISLFYVGWWVLHHFGAGFRGKKLPKPPP